MIFFRASSSRVSVDICDCQRLNPRRRFTTLMVVLDLLSNDEVLWRPGAAREPRRRHGTATDQQDQTICHAKIMNNMHPGASVKAFSTHTFPDFLLGKTPQPLLLPDCMKQHAFCQESSLPPFAKTTTSSPEESTSLSCKHPCTTRPAWHLHMVCTVTK